MEFRHRRRRERSTIELTPLVDVIFQLLVFFLLTANFLRPSLQLDLPSASAQDEGAPDVVRLEIDVTGLMAVDGTPVERDGLRAALEAAVAEGRTTVRVAADRGADYGVFVEALDAARLAGAVRFDIVHEGARER